MTNDYDLHTKIKELEEQVAEKADQIDVAEARLEALKKIMDMLLNEGYFADQKAIVDKISSIVGETLARLDTASSQE